MNNLKLKKLNSENYNSLHEKFKDNPYFDFDVKKVVDSVYDISKNNNHLLFYKRKTNLYNSTQYINQSKTSIL